MELVPLEAEHLRTISIQETQAVDKEFLIGECLVDEVAEHPGRTILEDGHPIAIFGWFFTKEREAFAWVMLCDGIGPMRLLKLTRLIEKELSLYPGYTVMTLLREGLPEAIVWADLLGFEIKDKLTLNGIEYHFAERHL